MLARGRLRLFVYFLVILVNTIRSKLDFELLELSIQSESLRISYSCEVSDMGVRAKSHWFLSVFHCYTNVQVIRS